MCTERTHKLVCLALGACLTWACTAVFASPARVIGQGPLALTETLTPSPSASPGATASPDLSATPTPSETPTLTLTPGSETPTPTSDGTIVPPTSTPTATPHTIALPLLWRTLRVLRNGGFETGAFAPEWRVGGALPSAALSSMQHSGTWAARLGNPVYDNRGGCPVGYASIGQVIDVPSLGESDLRFWYCIYSYDTIDYDHFAVTITVNATGAIQTAWLDGRTEWNEKLWSSGWQEGAISLDDYRGKTVTVRFVNAMTNADGWYNTWAFVDDVSLSTTLP